MVLVLVVVPALLERSASVVALITTLAARPLPPFSSDRSVCTKQLHQERATGSRKRDFSSVLAHRTSQALVPEIWVIFAEVGSQRRVGVDVSNINV